MGLKLIPHLLFVIERTVKVNTSKPNTRNTQLICDIFLPEVNSLRAYKITMNIKGIPEYP